MGVTVIFISFLLIFVLTVAFSYVHIKGDEEIFSKDYIILWSKKFSLEDMNIKIHKFNPKREIYSKENDFDVNFLKNLREKELKDSFKRREYTETLDEIIKFISSSTIFKKEDGKYIIYSRNDNIGYMIEV